MNADTITKILNRALGGDYSVRVDAEGLEGELAELADAVNTAIEFIIDSKRTCDNVQVMIQENPSPMLLLNTDFMPIDVNRAYEKMMEEDRNKILSMEASEYEIKLLKGEGADELFSKGKKTSCVLEIHFKDGRKLIAEQKGVPLKDDAGNITMGLFTFNDITKQKEEEEEVQKQLRKVKVLQERSEAIVQQNPMPIILCDKNFNIRVVNEAYAGLSGLSRERLLTMNVRDCEVLETTGEGLKHVFETKSRSRGIVKVRFKTGICILEQFGIPITNAKGDIVNILIVYNDITKQKQEEEEIHEQIKKIKVLQERSEVIVQQNPMPIILCDKKFNIRVVNEAYADLSGLSRERLLAMTLRDFEVLETTGEGLKHVFETKSRCLGVVTVKFPKGTRILEQYGIPIMNDKGDIVNILIVYNDITEIRKKQDEVLKLMEDAQKKAEILEESTKEVEKGMNAIKTGNFTYRMDITEGDPLSTLKDDYNNAISESRLLFSDAVQAMENIRNNMNDAASGTNEIAKASEQVAIGSQTAAELSRTAQSQVENITRAISDLSASNEEIASTSQEVLDQANNVTDMGREAENLGMEATEKMKLVADITNESVTEMEDLKSQLLEINNVLKLINDITNQINMLALNAAIEAARAGEHGRGFAVVAGEVKNLATDARNATAQVDTVIERIQAKSDKTAESIKSAGIQVESGVESVNATIDSLNRIVTGAEHVSANMSEIARAIEDQANITNNIVSDTERSNEVTAKTQNELEELAALSEETSASVEEINSAIQEVTSLSEELGKSLSRLQV